jgi:hypothetical protein
VISELLAKIQSPASMEHAPEAEALDV